MAIILKDHDDKKELTGISIATITVRDGKHAEMRASGDPQNAAFWANVLANAVHGLMSGQEDLSGDVADILGSIGGKK